MFAAFCIVVDVIPVLDQAGAEARWLLLYARKLEVEAVEAFRFLRSKNFEPILIKGWAAARNYPADRLRFYTDVDLAVASDDYDLAIDVLGTEEGKRFAIDLHHELRHLDTKPWSATFADSETVNLDGCPIRIPSAEDHLRIMAVHWLNDGGEKKERLWDIYYAVANRPADFDWEKCLGPVSTVRRGWIIASIGLAGRYLGLPIEGLPFEHEARNLPSWLTAAVEKEWRSGVPHRRLHTCLNDPAEFFRQLRKRIPPNPIQATIESEGDLRNGTRIWYQLQSMKNRILPSLSRVSQIVRLRAK